MHGGIVMLSRRTLITAAGSLLLTRPAVAAYPDRFVRFIVPFAPGGNVDTVARLVAAGMTKSLGQPIGRSASPPAVLAVPRILRWRASLQRRVLLRFTFPTEAAR